MKQVKFLYNETMIPFKQLTIDDRFTIQNFTKNFPPYSDFNFTSLWSYDVAEDSTFFIDENCFIIKLRDYVTNKPFYSFLAKKKAVDIISNLLSISEAEKLDRKLFLVPEDSIVERANFLDSFIIEEDRNSFDYVLSTDEISKLEGKVFEHQRWHTHQFLKYYPESCVKITDGKEKFEQEEIRRIFNFRSQIKGEESSLHERGALDRLLDSLENLSIVNVGLWIQNKLIGYALIEILHTTDKYAVGHFMKADTSYKGVYDTLYFQVATYLKSMDCDFLNYEQDLGIEKLRQAKLSVHPTTFLKKYTITDIQRT